MIITSEFFSFNVWEWFLHSSVLQRIESDLSKINWLRGVILLNPIVLVPWGRFPLCHTPIRPISAFRDQISILIVGCVTTWSRGSHQWLSKELKNDLSKNKCLRDAILILLVHESIFVGWGFLFLIVLVLWYKLSSCHTPIKPDLLGFPGIDVFARGLLDHVLKRFTLPLMLLASSILEIR